MFVQPLTGECQRSIVRPLVSILIPAFNAQESVEWLLATPNTGRKFNGETVHSLLQPRAREI